MRAIYKFIKSVITLSIIFILLTGISNTPALSQRVGTFEDWFNQQVPFTIPDNLAPATQFTGSVATTEQTVEKVSPAVVTIYGVTSEGVTRYRGAKVLSITSGTGFVVDPNGYIVTNKHVVANTGSRYTVELANGARKNAQVVYRHPSQDLAIIKISGQNLSTVNLGDSSKLKIGETVVGIGNSPARTEPASVGTITSTKRTVFPDTNDGEPLRNLIQTDAELFPGDSGGPLVTTDGTVVGVNTATAVGTTEPVSFFVPVNDVKNMLGKINKT